MGREKDEMWVKLKKTCDEVTLVLNDGRECFIRTNLLDEFKGSPLERLVQENGDKCSIDSTHDLFMHVLNFVESGVIPKKSQKQVYDELIKWLVIEDRGELALHKLKKELERDPVASPTALEKWRELMADGTLPSSNIVNASPDNINYVQQHKVSKARILSMICVIDSNNSTSLFGRAVFKSSDNIPGRIEQGQFKRVKAKGFNDCDFEADGCFYNIQLTGPGVRVKSDG